MASSAVSFLVKNLGTLIQKEVVLLWGVDKEMNKLSSTLSTILAVLDDAEMKQHQDKSIQDWLCKIRDASYVVRDILDECEAEALKCEIKHQSSGRLKKVWTSAITCYPAVNLYFRHQIGNRINDIIEDINAIAEERKMYHLNEGFIGNGLTLAADGRETSSALPPLEVFGREDDKENIVKLLTKEVFDNEGFSVYPIIGMGGLGKTTLAQMIYNDKTIDSHFGLKIWVYVSETFDVKQVMKQIIESTPGGKSEASTLDSLQKEIKERLSGKRYLLVLDDAWSEDQDEWDKLKLGLACGLPGACIVVTTRSEKVALVVGTLPTHYLLPLSEDDCWLLFRQRAFGAGNEERLDLVDIGKGIVKKCSGVPLAAKALGGLLRFSRGEEEWLNIAESNLWDISEDECSILPALRLSYYNLPLELRHCFSFCAVYLKGSKIEKDKLIQLWMANGLVSSKNKMEVEDVGNQIWNELYMRSFFQDEEKDSKGNSYFKMHDLMHDLSQFVMGDECQKLKIRTSSRALKQRVRHVILIGSMRHSELLEALKKQRSLHTLLFQPRDSSGSEFEYSWGSKDFGSLRVLDANGSRMEKFSGSVGNSKYLRYLNLSGTSIRELPASTCELPNLQTLNLNYCYELRMLPKKMKRLRSLRHLCLLGCWNLKDMPLELGKLKELKTLSLFVVGENNGQCLGELQHLGLGGELEIKHLERVKDSTDAKEANLVGKPNLRTVRFSWKKISSGDLVEQQEQVMDALEPHLNVKELFIKCYGGEEFPVWMGNHLILKNVVSIELSGCNNCVGLPALWKLPSLQRLKIQGMRKVEYMMQNSSYNTDGGFESLEKLEIVDLPNLIGLPVWMGNPSFLKSVVHIELKNCKNCLALPSFWQLPRLRHLIIQEMDKVEYMVTQNGNEDNLAIGEDNNVTSVVGGFPSLEKLEIRYLPNLKGIVAPMDYKEGRKHQQQQKQKQQELLLLPRLKSLCIDRCPQLTLQMFPALESLCIWDSVNTNRISEITSLSILVLYGNMELVSFPDEMFQNLTRLQTLEVHLFQKLKTLPGNMSNLVALKTLRITNCEELECLPDGGIGGLKSLLNMEIYNCPKIVCLPDSIQTLTQLQSLSLTKCSPDLERRCEKESGQDWYKIAHIPNVVVWDSTRV